jgi:protein arginine kinase activator
VSDKLCDVCGKQPAKLRFTEIDEGQIKKKRALCKVCAEAQGLLEPPPVPALTLQQLLAVASPGGKKSAAETATSAAPERTCGGCGLSFAAFRKQGRLGCPACYTAFETELTPLLRKIHAAARHVGKTPHTDAHQVALRQQIRDLRAELERAVRAEDYERAAGLRDEMRAVEKEQTSRMRRGDGDAPPESAS